MAITSNQIPKLTGNQSKRLRIKLLRCNYMKQEDSRRQIKSDLQKDFKEIIIRSSSDPQIDIAGMIDSCLDYGGVTCLKGLLTILEGYEGAAADTMKAVWLVWDEIVSPPVPGHLKEQLVQEGRLSGPPPKPTRVPKYDELRDVGSEFHWDRDHLVDEFLDTVLARPGKQDIRVLAIPAPAEADPDRFVQYLEAKCAELSRLTDIGARIVPVRLHLTDPQQPYQIVVRVLQLLASKSKLCEEGLHTACEQIRKEWEPRERRGDLSLTALAKKFSINLQESAKICRPVILIHGLDDSISDSLRSWVLYTWLESSQLNLQGIVVVLAGSPNLGLEALGQPPHMVCFDPLPELDSRDLWEWAYYGHGLTWVKQELVWEYNKKEGHGSAVKFYNYIQTLKTLEDPVARESLLKLLSDSSKS